MTDRDPRCGCPTDQVVANRAERRMAHRRGMVAETITLHQDDCIRGIHPRGPTRGSVRRAKRQ